MVAHAVDAASHDSLICSLGVKPPPLIVTLLMIDPDPTVSGGFDLVILDLDDGVTTPLAQGVCAGALDLVTAQHAIAVDWQAAAVAYP